VTHEDLSHLLERSADRTQVGPAPLDAMMTRVRRARRRRDVLVTSAATVLAVVAVVAVDVALSEPGDNPSRTPSPVASPSPTPAVPTPQAAGETSLDGTWKVTALVGAGGHSVLTGRYADDLRLTFRDGQVTGSSGCNDIFGGYTQSGEAGADVSIPSRSLGSTLVGCHEPPLLQRLGVVRHVSGSGDTRTLHGESWMIIVQMRRVDPG
jgi:heat shock protein HslJ